MEAAAPCRFGTARGEGPIATQPWAAKWLAPERAWPLSRAGEGVKVAVVDTGVDATHPQLASAVLPGADFVGDAVDGRVDCVGHGTAVASIIAARPAQGAGFVGIAPLAQILPVRVAERLGDDVDPAKVAAGIRWATANGAAIVNVSLLLPDTPVLRDAVAEAVKAGVVVIAAAGQVSGNRRPAASPFPAGYEGVLGISATGPDGLAPDSTWTGVHVDLAAPGLDLITAAPQLGHTTDWGRSPELAAATASGAAALVKAGKSDLDGPSLAQRLRATADPAPGGPRSTKYGYGYINPYRALIEPMPSGSPAPHPAKTIAIAPPPHVDTRVSDAATVTAGSAIGATLLLTISLTVARRRRRRRLAEKSVAAPDGRRHAE